MRERRYVKFKLDIYDDTKTKIIDQRPERDFIHYFFARSIILAGKADCEGNLYMAKNIPYTIETLAIEFNREVTLIKLALDLLIQLKMIEVIQDNIYRVKGFVKHQNIKVKENAEINDKEKTNAQIESNKEVEINKDKQLEDSRREKIQEEFEYKNKQIQEENKEITNDNVRNTDVVSANMEDVNINNKQAVDIDLINITGEENIYVNSESDNISNYLGNKNTQENIQYNSEQDNQNNLVVLETKDNQKSKKKRKSESKLVTEIAADEIEDKPILVFLDGDMPPLEEGERLVWGQTLG
ncbi:phage replisome organizer N-terminal domain-containing protein [Clostridium sp. C2-6-12]|uniref:phage replisome organizer N-terminal domain-containing protein n=1 Tax=Clostridium sp. C2-6-12 TaxID=2698832 RepID=UPI00136801C9|nr:phage replisome organizer N-terminal domain-containing protein [Clostridium sp. C2-6-12]